MAKRVEYSLKDFNRAIATILQTLIVQLMESGVLTVEQGQRVFDAAVKRRRASDEADVADLIEALSEQMKWDEIYEAIADFRRAQKPRAPGEK